MTRDEIINDIKFRQKCVNYGLNLEKFKLFRFANGDYIISLLQPIEEIYVLFDKNYNIICIEKCDWIIDDEDLKNFIKVKYNNYRSLPDEFPLGKNFGYPFEKLTLKQIIDLSNRVEIMEINHGHSLYTRVNGDWYDRNSQEHEDKFKLLSYIKFLGEEIKQYFLLSYQMQTMGFEVPDVYSYVRKLISKVNNCVFFYLEHNRRPYPADILRTIGQNNSDFNGILYDIVDLLMKTIGIKVKNGSPDELEPEEKKDFSKIVTQLLKILEISDEDLKKKERERREKMLEMQHDTFQAWLKDDFNDHTPSEKDPILSKEKNN